MNKVILMGRFCFDTELKTTENGIEVLSNKLAVNRAYSKEGKKADFINVVAWRKTAAFINQYFKKGDGIVIEGSIQTRTYVTDDGQNRDIVEVLIERVDFPLSNKDRQPSASISVEKTDDSEKSDFNALPMNGLVDDDLPF
jgi:single-strand DNA-binding protein